MSILPAAGSVPLTMDCRFSFRGLSSSFFPAKSGVYFHFHDIFATQNLGIASSGIAQFHNERDPHFAGKLLQHFDQFAHLHKIKADRARTEWLSRRNVA